MITYLVAHLILVAFNFLNAQFDSGRIKANKRIFHGVNLGVITLLCGLICWVAGWNVGVITLFLMSAFCNRQLSFDIPLNHYRGLPWYYVSPEKPPKSITDQIEIQVFGYNGRAPVYLYAAVWVVCLIVKMFV